MTGEKAGLADLTIGPDGAQLYASLLPESDIERLRTHFSECAPAMAGYRVQGPELGWLLDGDSVLVRVAAELLGGKAWPVRAVFFNKDASSNWLTPWHQDRTIPLQARHDLPGFQVWSLKNGIHHVEPPMEVIKNMVTLKVHLDPCYYDSGPIRIALGSHRLGRVEVSGMEAAVANAEHVDCVAAKGDVWAVATSILHSSGKSTRADSRRILHLDFANYDLPQPLQWLPLT